MNRTIRALLASGSVALLATGPVPARAAPAPVAPAPVAPALVMPVLGGAVASRPAPRPDHVVIVVLENKRYDSVIGHRKTRWITSLAGRSANMLNFSGETHPSQPNYLALFSGSMQGVRDNNCPYDLGDRTNLGSQLLAGGWSFVGYAEDLPSPGWRGCAHRKYVRRHNPWVNFANVPASANQPFTAFPRDYRKLPTVALVIPNLCHDMHDCPKERSDIWLKKHFAPYVAWARKHNSLFVLTFDEDNKTDDNHIPTVIAGAGVRPGRYGAHLDHYDLLHTLQRMYALPLTGVAKHRKGLPSLG